MPQGEMGWNLYHNSSGKVSPWKIELALTYTILSPLPMPWPEPNMVPLSPNSSVLTQEGILKSQVYHLGSLRVTIQPSQGSGFSRVSQCHEISTFGDNFAKMN
ncbi:hypothetical protein QQP08_013426 [Theobroma cacao]|nr:hypothetical protein QQP08_013426 [Theobroma cacao]